MMTPRSGLLATAMISVSVVAACLWPHIRYGYDFADTVDCLLTTGGHKTRYAPGYSDFAFNRVRLGMSRSEVLDILGEPLERYAPWQPDFAWRYSVPATNTGHFHLRELRFSPEGLVIDII